MTDPTPYTSYRIAGWSGLTGGLIRLLTNAAFDDPIMQRSRALVHDGAEFHQLVALFTARPDLAYALVGPVGDVTQVVVHGGVRADLITPTETIEVAGTPDGGDWAGHMITAAVLGVTLTAAAHSPQQMVNPGVRATTAPEIAGPIAVPAAPAVPPFEPRIPDPPRLPDQPRLPDPVVMPVAVEPAPDRSGPTTTAPPTVPPPPLRPTNYAATALRTIDTGSAAESGAVPPQPEPAASRPDAEPRYAEQAPIDPVPEPTNDDRADAGRQYVQAYVQPAQVDSTGSERVGGDQPHPSAVSVEPPYQTDADRQTDRDDFAYPDRADAEPSYAEPEPRVVSWDEPPVDPVPAVPAQRSAGLISDVSWASMLDGPDAPAPAEPAPASRIDEARWADVGTWSTPSAPAEPAGPYRQAEPYDRSTPWSDPVDHTSRLAPGPVAPPADRWQPSAEPVGWTQEVPPARSAPVADTSWADAAAASPPVETVGWAAETAVMPVVQPVHQPERRDDPAGRRQDLDVTIWRPIAESSVMTRDTGTVSAVRCVDGHLNPLIANSCRVCTKLVPPQEPVTVGRPPLGIVRMSTSDVIRLDHGIIFGRDPGSPDGNRRDQPYFVMLADKDISRRHLEVVLDGWDVLVVDLNSSNGSAITMPGGVPEVIPSGARRQLVPGTVVHLSDSISFVFEVTA